MALAYRCGGDRGLLLLPAGTLLILFAGVAWFLRRRGVGDGESLALLAVLSTVLATQLRVVRPQLFSGIGLMLSLLVLDAAERRGPIRLLWLAPIFALWANLHGGWLVGVGVVGLWAVVAASIRRIPPGWAALTPCLAILASLANPYGWRLWLFLWQTVGLERADITEWQSVLSQPIALTLWVPGAVVVAVAWWKRRASDLHRLIPVTVLALLALKVVRLDASLAIAAVVMTGPLAAGTGSRRFRLSPAPGAGELVAVGLATVAAASVAGWFAWSRAGCMAMGEGLEFTPESDAVRFAELNQLAGRMVTWFDYGEYAIWHLSPEIVVSLDGRRETVYSDKVLQAHQRFYDGRDPGYAQRLGADYVWVPSRLPLAGQLTKAGWTSIFRGSKSQIFAWRPGHYEQVGPVPGPRCFPGP